MDNSILEKVNNIEQPTLKAILLHIHQKLQSINGDLDNITQILDGGINGGGDVNKSDIIDLKHQIKKTDSILSREIQILSEEYKRDLKLINEDLKKLRCDVDYKVSRVNTDVTHNLSMLRNTIVTPNRSKSNTKINFRK